MSKDTVQAEEKDMHPLMVCEAFNILDEYRTRALGTNKPRSYLRFFESVLNYAEACLRIKSKGQIDTLRSILSKIGLSNTEISKVGTLFPQSIDEARVLIPSLCRLSEEDLSRAIKSLEEF